MTAVIDASVLVKWFVEEEGSDQARSLQNDLLFAPDLVIVETTNILWKKVRIGGFEARDVAPALKALQHSDLVIEPGLDLAARAFDIGHGLDHAVYDCFYLALAEHRSMPFVSADVRLSRKMAERPRVTSARLFSIADYIGQRKLIS